MVKKGPEILRGKEDDGKSKIMHADDLINYQAFKGIRPDTEYSKIYFSFMHTLLQSFIEAAPLRKFFFESKNMHIVRSNEIIEPGESALELLVDFFARALKARKVEHVDVRYPTAPL